MFDDNLCITLISMKLNHAAVIYFNCRKALPKCTQIEHEKKKSSDFQFSKEYRPKVFHYLGYRIQCYHLERLEHICKSENVSFCTH